MRRDDVKIYISAVSKEFRSYREALRRDLDRPNVTVKIQEDFMPYGRGTLDKLDDYIKACDVVIHLVGDRTGGIPNPDALRGIKSKRTLSKMGLLGPETQISYTQWEAYLAVAHRKTVLIAKPKRNAPRDSNDRAARSQKKSQADHLVRLRQLGRYAEIDFHNADHLIAQVLRRLQDFLPPPPNGTENESKEQDRYQNEIENSVKNVRETSYEEALHQAKQSLLNTMGALTERFGASSAYLFLRDWLKRPGDPWIEPECPLMLFQEHNTGITADAPPTPAIAKLKLQGITGRVAATGRPCLAKNVDDFKKEFPDVYLPTVKDTKSDMAVPIMHTDKKGEERVIGVLNLESKNPNAFLEVHVGELMAAATKLALDILVVQHLKNSPETFGWHPGVSGWTLKRLLDEFCATVADDPKEPGYRSVHPYLPRPSCTVWYADFEKGLDEVHVRSTARFDYEYLHRSSLRIASSFTGSVAQQHDVVYGDPQRIESFRRRGKADAMGMVYVIAAPVYLPDRPTGSRAVGTVNLYFFKEDLSEEVKGELKEVERRFPRKLTLYLAKELGKLISNCQQLKSECASAYLRYRLHEHALPGLTDFDTVKEVLLECVDAHYCSLFARQTPELVKEPHSSRGLLRCVATTGLQNEDGSMVEAADAFYDLDDLRGRGLSFYLAKKKGRTFRRRSIVAYQMAVERPKSTQPLPRGKYRETFSLSDTEHRPFLGVSVDDPLGKTARPGGVIRLLRKSGSKPFVKTDERLLQRLGRETYPLFLRWAAKRGDTPRHRALLCGARFPFSIRVVGQSPTSATLEAIDRLGSEFPAGAIWNRGHVTSVLIDLVNAFRNAAWRTSGKQGGLIANFRVEVTQTPRRYRVFAIHRLGSGDPPTEEEVKEHESVTDSVGLRTLEWKCPITFDRSCEMFSGIFPESKQVTSGVCMPVRFFSGTGINWGVLSVDCDNMAFDQWRSEHLEVVALAAKKLDYVGRDNCFADNVPYQGETWSANFDTFRNVVLKDAGVKFCNVFEGRLRRGGLPSGHCFPMNLSQKNELSSKAVRFLKAHRISDETLNEDVLDWNPDGGFRVTLRYGAFKPEPPLTLIGVLASAKVTDFQRDFFRSRMALQMAEINHLWNRLASSRIETGIKPLFRLAFEIDPDPNKPSEKGLRYWKPVLNLAPDIFGR